MFWIRVNTNINTVTQASVWSSTVELNFSKQEKYSVCNGIRTLNHLVRKRTFNHLGQFGYTSDMVPALSMEFLDIQTNYKFGLTLTLLRGMIITCSQEKYRDFQF